MWNLSPISIALVVGLLGRSAPAEPAAETIAVSALERVALIGASVTDGFLLPNEVGAMVTLADVVKASARQPIDLPFRRSNVLFFRDPLEYGTRYAREAKTYDPSLLIAVDFLFWFGYGFSIDEESRHKRLEQGLALLEEFDCPVIAGNLPDMRLAATDGVGIHGAPMIYEWQVPEKETLAKLNARIEEWAAEKPSRHVVHVAEFFEKVRNHETVAVRENHWGKDAFEQLMDKDLLHTTFEGSIGLTLFALDTWVREDESIPEDAFLWNVDEVRRRVLEARKKEREQRGATVEEG